MADRVDGDAWGRRSPPWRRRRRFGNLGAGCRLWVVGDGGGAWYVHFASCFHVDIYRFMDCYYTLWYHIYAFSLLFCKVYLKRENTGSWNYGLEKEQVWVLYFAQLQIPWKSTWNFLGIYKKYWAKEVPHGSCQGPTSLVAAVCPPGHGNRACGHPGGPLAPSFAIWRVSSKKKSRWSFSVDSPPPWGGTWADPI